MKPLDVAIFAPLLATGGTQRHVQELVRLLEPHRVRVEVITLRSGGEVAEELCAAGVSVRSLDIPGGLADPRTVARILGEAGRLRATGVAVVHGYQWRPGLVAAVAGRLARVPVVVVSKRSLGLGGGWGRVGWRVIGRLAHCLLVNAEAVGREAAGLRIARRFEVIPSGVDGARFAELPPAADARGALGLEPRRPVIGTVGRLEPRKGQVVLLRAAQALLRHGNGRAPQVLLVGDGPLRGELEAEAERLGVASVVRFAGSVADVRLPLAAMDVFVLPSNAEGMSNALLEAMAAGRPVIATKVGGNVEVIEQRRSGLLVQPGDAEGLARAVLSLLGDPDGAARLGAAARRRVGERFAAATMAAATEKLYRRLLRERGVGA